jgi:hypothetical protein
MSIDSLLLKINAFCAIVKRDQHETARLPYRGSFSSSVPVDRRKLFHALEERCLLLGTGLGDGNRGANIDQHLSGTTTRAMLDLRGI